MSIEITTKAPKVRILSGEPLKVDAELNSLLDEYTITMQAVHVVVDHIEVTFLLIHQSELRKMGLANLNMPGMRQ